MTWLIFYLAPSVIIAAVTTIYYLRDHLRLRNDTEMELVILSLEDAYWSPSYQRHHEHL